ncbi:glycoside hydrolase 5 family protein [Herpetosiphon geysericola]|uniref:mannan endo-1,4-beta-mannosidase n=1 Tax=Herpetosiphon geysericola TaxID=70996 RepID=A0A0P6Y5D4_9CHLR|nr:cellulase family glycosylhydrolase [Herpetosiphon geysericola]KPL80495.1 hypothetical protein SE18_23840 [Herpetosiphon geysericola]
MSQRRFKIIIWLLFLLMLGQSGVWVVGRVAWLVASFQQGADPASALKLPPILPPEATTAIQWLPDDADTGRVMEDFTRQQLTSDYGRAWLQWNTSLKIGRPYNLRTSFSGPALHYLTTSISASANMQIDQIDTAHRLQLHFYAADGSIVALTDTQAEVYQLIYDVDGKLVSAQWLYARYELVMLLQDGTWRIRHWVRHELSVPLEPTYQPKPQFVQSQQHDLQFEQRPFIARGVNYYPSATPWLHFWPAYQPQQTTIDLGLIQQLNLNSVRIFIPFAQFTEPYSTSLYLRSVTDFLDQAEQANIKVIVTLFDFLGDYQLARWQQTDSYLTTVVTSLRDHPAIMAWDVKNEPDRDYATASQGVVEAWLTHTIRQLRRLDPHHLITIGWSTPAAAERLSQAVDLVSFHYYAAAEQLPAAYQRLKQIVGDKPLLLTESGLSTWNSPFFPHGHDQREQAAYVINVSQQAESHNGFLIWTLFDIPDVPSTIAGFWPWQRGPQMHLGLYTADYEPKVIGNVLRGLEPVPVVRWWEAWRKPFRITVIGISMLGIIGGWRTYSRRQRKKRRTG